MKQLKDRVLEVSQTQGTGDYALAGAVTGFRAFSPAVNVGDTADYYAEEVDGTGVPSGAWETGMGTYATGNKLQRTTIYASSNGGTPINWGVGTRRVAISLTSQTLADAVNSAEIASGYAAAANAAKVAAQAAAAAAAASAATIDLSAPNPIGNATPNTGAFTTLSATGDVFFGTSATTNAIILNGINSGTGGGAAMVAQNAGVPVIALGNKSALIGGAYSTTPMLYGNTTIETNVGLSVTGALSATGNVTLGDSSTDTLNVGNGGLIKDAAGNVGIGVTPSAWPSSTPALQLTNGALSSLGGPYGQINLASNAYASGSNDIGSTVWRYTRGASGDLGAAARYSITANNHYWYTAPMGLAGDPITFTQAMTLGAGGLAVAGTLSASGALTTAAIKEDAAGNVGIGVTPIAGAGSLQFPAGNQIGNHGDNFHFTSASKYVAGWLYTSTGTPALRYEQLAGNHRWYTAPSGTAGDPITFKQSMTLDASGNLGIGVTPSAWGTTYKASQILRGSRYADNYVTGLSHNAYFDAGWRYIASALPVTIYEQYNGGHTWYTAASGTAGDPIPFKQIMSVDSTKMVVASERQHVATGGYVNAAGGAYKAIVSGAFLGADSCGEIFVRATENGINTTLYRISFVTDSNGTANYTGENGIALSSVSGPSIGNSYGKLTFQQTGNDLEARSVAGVNYTSVFIRQFSHTY